MINLFLRGKYFWESGNSNAALSLLQEILANENRQDAFYIPDRSINYYIPYSFENAVSSILLDENELLIPFESAFERLWNIFPTQFLVLILHQKLLTSTHINVTHILHEAAFKGLLSNDFNDYDLSGKVVLRRDDFPGTFDAVAGDFLYRQIFIASQKKSWISFAKDNPVLLINLFLYAVFHREREWNQEMILIRLERISETHTTFLNLFNKALSNCLNHSREIETLVKIGMRMENIADPSQCLHEFIKAIRDRTFEEFLTLYHHRMD